MYSVEIKNKAVFDTFLAAVDTDWVDVVLTPKAAMFTQNVSETFAAYQMPAECSAGEPSYGFRVQKSLLKLLTVEGRINMTVSSDTVEYEFVNDVVRRTVTAPRHQSFTFQFKEKLEVLQRGKASEFNAAELKPMFNIASKLYSFVEVVNGVAGIMTRGGLRIYRKVNAPSFCLSAKAAHSLYSCNNLWYSSQNYIYAVNGSFGIVVSQCRGSGQEDFSFLEEDDAKAAAVAIIDFTDVTVVASKLPKATISLDLRAGCCRLANGDVQYAIQTPLEDVRMNDRFNKEVPLLTKLFTDILPKMPSRKVLFRVKPYYCLAEVDGYTIVCK